MINARKLSQNLSVCGQIAPDDIAKLKTQGFNSIICNRPDKETDNQPTFASIADAATAAGLQIRHIPVIPGKIKADDIAGFKAALEELPAPTLAYCRTGTRSRILYEMATQPHQ